MKATLFCMSFLSFLLLFSSCTKDELENENFVYEIDLNIVHKNDIEMSREILQLINDHRNKIGLNALILDTEYASAYAVDHTDYMIGINQINHDNFPLRMLALQNRGAVRVGENVAFGYISAEGVVNAWLNSPAHLDIIEGNYTHSGFGVFQNNHGCYYFTQLFYFMN
jgi:uncharacterized protein YkwD